jgi:hypothetical protein
VAVQSVMVSENCAYNYTNHDLSSRICSSHIKVCLWIAVLTVIVFFLQRDMYRPLYECGTTNAGRRDILGVAWLATKN